MVSGSLSLLLWLLSSARLASVAAFAPIRPDLLVNSHSVSSHTRLALLLHQTTKTETETDEETEPYSTKTLNLFDEEFAVSRDSYDGAKPDSSWNLAAQNFQRQGATLLDQIKLLVGLETIDPTKPPHCLNVTLSNFEVSETERRRLERGNGVDEDPVGGVDAHPVSLALYNVGCLFLDNLFDGRPIQRFWFLETIARIPYFSYVSMLHLYESLGWWRAVELRKIHNAQEWNELHHLLIMESLGGNSLWSDRFLGYHIAIAYYWFLNIVFLGSPRVAYQFMELLEAHAVDTYTTFATTNREQLAELPAPSVAISYYKTGDPYLFDDFQMRPPGSRRPPCDTLLDVFENIAKDEAEHVKTMQACQDYALLGTRVVSSHAQFPPSAKSKRVLWKEWSDDVNSSETSDD